jgi:hypothetical protein
MAFSPPWDWAAAGTPAGRQSDEPPLDVHSRSQVLPNSVAQRGETDKTTARWQPAPASCQPNMDGKTSAWHEAGCSVPISQVSAARSSASQPDELLAIGRHLHELAPYPLRANESDIRGREILSFVGHTPIADLRSRASSHRRCPTASSPRPRWWRWCWFPRPHWWR